MARTLDIVGEENFSKICARYQLNGADVRRVKQILDQWDNLMTIEDFLNRQERKIDVMSSAVAGLSPQRSKAITGALLETILLYADLWQKRQ